MPLALLLACVCGMAPLASAAAEAAATGTDACRDAMTTQAMVECGAVEAKAWDQRLNKAYDALTKRVDVGQRTPLVDAQRLWIRYRNANCGFYGMTEGSIGRVQSAECVRSMTQHRACELEVAHSAEAEPAADCK